TVLETVKSVMLRGGSLVSCIFLYVLCRQVSLLILRLPFRRTVTASSGTGAFKTPSHENYTLAFFHVNPIMIWVFSAALLLVVLTRILRMQIPEIILWNILVLCVILYLAQGLGIIQFLLSRSSLSPFLKLALTLLMVFLLFSPFLNMLLLGGFFILGIIENWVPLRVLKKNAPPSTPEAGDDV
ncbi:MAG: YybS family protein, partial [Treponema sp.]|nr:YybS family protein [Treponema sp.]